MTQSARLGGWYRRTTSSSFRLLASGLLASSLLGIAAGVAQSLLHWHLHLPGHSAFIWLAFLATAPLAARRHGSALVAAISGTTVVLLWPGMTPVDTAALFIYPFTGLLIDLAFGRLANRFADALLVALVGGLAFTAASVIHAQWFLAHRPGAGLAVFAAYHLVFGIAGGALGAGLLPALRHLSHRQGALGATFLAVLALTGMRRARAAVEQLGTIVVTGHGARQYPGPGLIWSVSAREIAASGAVNLAQVLALVPGVHLRLAAQGVPRVDIWGLRTRQIKLLINGVPVNSPYDGNFDPSLIPAGDIEKIVVTTGDSSVLYGTGAMGGVINIITRSGSAGGWKGGIDAEGGSGNYRRGAATLSGGGRGWSSFFMVDHQSRDSFPMSSGWTPTTLQDGGQRQNSASQSNMLYAHSRFAAGPSGQVGLTVRRTTAAYGIPPSAFDNTTDPFANKPNYERIENLVDSLYQVSGLYVPTGPFRFRGWVYATDWHENDNRYDSPTYSSISDPTLKGTYLLYLAAHTKGLHLQPLLTLSSNQRLVLGLDSQTADWTEQGVIRDVSSAGGGGGGGGGGPQHFGLRHVDTARTVRTSSLIAEYALDPAPRVALTIGASENRQRRDVGPDQTIPGYDVAVQYRWTGDTTLKASAGRKVQFPTLQELYDPTSGNPDLSAQTVNVYQAGIDRTWSAHLDSSATLFFLDTHGFIEKDQRTDLYANFEHYRMDGVQLHVDVQPTDDLSLSVSYTYLNARNRASGSSVDQLQYRPRHQLTLQATYRPTQRVTLFAAGYYVADQVYYAKRGPAQKASLANYVVADFRVGYAFTGYVTGYVGARNLFDRNYMQSYGYPAPGRVVYAGISTRFNL